MKISREEKKLEAIKRMEKIHYWKQAKEKFRRNDKIFVNEPPFGAVYELDPVIKEEVEKFEAEHDALVYMVVRAFTAFGMMDSLLFVGDNADEWEMDNEDLSNGYAFTYTINHDAPDCSEFGSIGFRLGAGAGLVRVA